MNAQYRKPLPGTGLDWFDARAAVEAIAPGAYDGLPYTSRVLAENLVRRCDPALLKHNRTRSRPLSRACRRSRNAATSGERAA